MIGLAGAVLSTQLFAGAALAGQSTISQQELINEIEMLKNIVMDLNDRLAGAEEMLQLSLEMSSERVPQEQAPPNEEMVEFIDELDERLEDAERHTTIDKVTMGVELEARFNSIHMDVATMPAATQIQIGQLAIAGSNFSAAEVAGLHQMLKQQGVEKQSIDNDALFTSRLRLDLKARPTRSLSFVARLSAAKVFGDSTGV